MNIYLFIFFIFLLSGLVPTIKNWNVEETQSYDFATYMVQNLNQTNVNCEKETHLCSTDDDCIRGCLAGMQTFICIDQKCSFARTIEADPETFNCNETHGIYLLLRANGEFHCTSLYSHFYNNLDQQQDFNCERGTLQVDTNKEAPKLSSCKCNASNKLVTNYALPHIPTCIPKNSVAIDEYLDVK